MIPLTQTPLWANLNEHFNGLIPYEFSQRGISCLFGYDSKNRTITSFGGPIISSSISEENFENFIKELLEKIKNENIGQVNFRAFFPLRKWPESYENKFTNFKFQHHPWKTFIIDLKPTQDELLKALHHAARKGIKKAQQLGVYVYKCESFEDCYTEFLVPYLNTTKRFIKEKNFYQVGWELDQDKCYTYWVAKNQQNQLLGFLGSYRYDGVATEIMSALTPLAWKQKIPVQDLLHWEIIKYHKNCGDLYFDLAGFNPNPISEKEKNIKRFKEKWGGGEYDTSSYTLDLRSPFKKMICQLRKKIHD
jgi:hypothetical protein